MGEINVFSGPMRSGKSQRICTEFNRQKIAGKNIQMFKPTIDNRAGVNIVETRDGKRIEAIMPMGLHVDHIAGLIQRRSFGSPVYIMLTYLLC